MSSDAVFLQLKKNSLYNMAFLLGLNIYYFLNNYIYIYISVIQFLVRLTSVVLVTITKTPLSKAL